MSDFHSLEVEDVREVAEQAVEVCLRPSEASRAAFAFVPGQHLVLRAFIGGEELRRTYSLTSASDETPLRICARVQGQFSSHLAGLGAGDTIDALTPKGSFHVPAHSGASRHCLAFAAGCGITPVFSLAQSLLEDEPESLFSLIYCNQSRARAMLIDELFALKDRYCDRFSLTLVMSRETGEIDLLNGRIDRPWLRRIAGKVFSVDADSTYVCGPGTMIADVSAALVELGMKAESIHAEHFSVETVQHTNKTTTTRAEAVRGEIEVEVRQAGRRRRFTMPSQDRTLLEAGLEAGFELPYSCMGGVCSTCRAELLEGEVEMIENYALEADEVARRAILVCQSLPRSRRITISYD